MSMLRQDPLTGRWVIIAAGRSARPNEFPPQRWARSPAAGCPFCPGHEDQTPPEVSAVGRPTGSRVNGAGWRLRTVPNAYPALVPIGARQESGIPAGPHRELFRHVAGTGCHEVVVYTPDHLGSPATLGTSQWNELLLVLRDRARNCAAHPEVRYVSAFCNHGPEAGATLAHPHMQIIGAPEVPLLAARKASRSASYLAAQGNCLVCDLAAAEREQQARLIAANDDWTVWAPWASRFPWEMIYAPRRHRASLMAASDGELAALAAVLARTLRKLFAIHEDPSLNIVIHSTTVDSVGNDQDAAAFHWHLEVLPRLSRPAGFEVGTGYTINSVVPEDAAAKLRQE